YGNKPAADDKLPAYDPAVPLSKSFGNPVHCVRLSNDGLVYVCDRVNDRIQVFRQDGTFVKEIRVEPQTLANGSVWDLALSIHLPRRRRERSDPHAFARGWKATHTMGTSRAPTRPVQVGAQHCD